ncbi:hypothetical protein GOODEAATRI_030649 [Goodea atripinnis]|uniref:Galectin n=1 Tax=Goodea atripinnis TaxID=208336 RepID=A0ABV0MWI6_9TELE
MFSSLRSRPSWDLHQQFPLKSIPFAGTILGGLLPGEMVLIQGSVPSGADRFQVDLTCGSSVKPRADVAFHFNPRIKKSCIVCNTLEKEQWGREEILYQMPLKVGPGFELIILVLKDKYKVAVNGAHVLEYKHRVDLDRVDTISISGIVNVQTVAVLPPDSMIVLCNQQHFRVAVNGLHQFHYRHRVQDLSTIGHLEVKGDVSLLEVRML